MTVLTIPLGSSGSIAVAVSDGKVSVTETYSAQGEIDALLVKLQSEVPVFAQPLIAAAKAAVDLELAQP